MLLVPDTMIYSDGSPSFITSDTEDPNTTSHTYSGITFPSGNIVVALMCSLQNTGFSATIKGVTATNRVVAVNTTVVVVLMDATVTAGSGDIVVTADTGNVNRSSIGVWGVGSRAYVSGNTDSAADPLSLDLTLTSGDTAIIAGYIEDLSGTTTSPTGFTDDFNQIVEFDTRVHNGGMIYPASGGATTLEVDASASRTMDYGTSGIWR